MATDVKDMDLTEILRIKGADHDAYDLAAIAAAQEAADDECEVDAITLTSRGNDEDGCFVLAWVWVSRDEMKLDDPLHDEDEADDAENEVEE